MQAASQSDGQENMLKARYEHVPYLYQEHLMVVLDVHLNQAFYYFQVLQIPEVKNKKYTWVVFELYLTVVSVQL